MLYLRNAFFSEFVGTMLMKEIDERILGNEVFIAEKYRVREFAFVDIATDRGDILMQEFGYLASGVEVEVDSHSSPKILFNWFLVSKLRDLIFPSTRREAQAGVLFAISAIFTWLKLLSMHQSMNFFISLPSSFLFMTLNNIIKFIKYVKHY